MEVIIIHSSVSNGQFIFLGYMVYGGIQVHLIIVDINYTHLISDSALSVLRPHWVSISASDSARDNL